MSTMNVCRLVVRLQGAMMFFNGVLNLTYLNGYYRATTIIHEAAEQNAFAFRSFVFAILRLALEFSGGFLLTGATDKVIGIFIDDIVLQPKGAIPPKLDGSA